MVPNRTPFQKATAARVIAAALFLTSGLQAQLTGGSSPPYGDIIVTDAAGNWYGPSNGQAATTPGAAQLLQPANVFLCGLFRPCDDVILEKTDPAGQTIYRAALGGPGNDRLTALAVDASGNLYATGTTQGPFPTTAQAAIADSGTSKTFLAKLSADGSKFLYVTYLPDTIATTAAIAVDAQGNAYVAGTSATSDAVVIKANPDGSAFLFSKTWGGTGQDAASLLAMDGTGNLLVAGQTGSPEFPILGGLQSKFNGVQDVFLMKLDPSGQVLFSTLLGGTRADRPNGLKLDAAGNIYLAGETTSLDFPTTDGSFQSKPIVPAWNSSPGGFLAKLNPDARAVLYSTYVMSRDNGTGRGVTSLSVTGAGDAYFTGTSGAGFPVTRNAPLPCLPTYVSTFLVHLDPQGHLVSSTYAGPPNSQAVYHVAAVDDFSISLIAVIGSVSQLRFADPLPFCLSTAVLNAATQLSGAVAPGEILTLSGVGIGPPVGVSYQPDAQGLLPRSLGGVTVLLDGRPIPILYAQANQVNVLVPYELKGATVTTLHLQYNNVTMGPIPLGVSFAAPGILRIQPNVSTVAFAINEDGTANGPANPAPKGSAIAMWGTGFGPMNPECTTGGINAPRPVYMDTGYGVTVLGYAVDPTIGYPGNGLGPVGPTAVGVWNVEYVGGAPEKLCGVQQLNLRVPTDLAAGEYAIVPRSIHTYYPEGQTQAQSMRLDSQGVATIFVK